MMMCFTEPNNFQFLQLLMIAGLFDVSVSSPVLSHQDNVWESACASSTVVTCTLDNVPAIAMSWRLNGTIVAECDPASCTPWVNMPSHYEATVGSGTVYHLSIDPVKLTDNYMISCKEGSNTVSNTLAVEAQFVEDMLTNETIEDDNGVTVIVTTNCLASPTGVKVYLTYKKELSTSAFEDYSDGTSNRDIIQCTNTDNPDCGGNAASKINATMNIRTDSNGDVHIFLLVVKENGIIVYQQELGRYNIKEDSPAPEWCNENPGPCRSVIIGNVVFATAIGVVIFFCCRFCSCCHQCHCCHICSCCTCCRCCHCCKCCLEKEDDHNRCGMENYVHDIRTQSAEFVLDESPYGRKIGQEQKVLDLNGTKKNPPVLWSGKVKPEIEVENDNNMESDMQRISDDERKGIQDEGYKNNNETNPAPNKHAKQAKDGNMVSGGHS